MSQTTARLRVPDYCPRLLVLPIDVATANSIFRGTQASPDKKMPTLKGISVGIGRVVRQT